jgi:GntR family transcriptional regulator
VRLRDAWTTPWAGCPSEESTIMAGPLYREIARDLRRKINSGALPQGSQLPTEDELIEQYHASRNTVRGALRELSVRGLVYTLHGKGTFVTEEAPPIVITLSTDPKTGRGGGEGLVYTAEVAASGRKATTNRLAVGVQKAAPNVATSLRIPEGSDVIFRHEERLVDGQPWSLQTSFYPRPLADRAPRLLDTDDISEGAVAYLRSCGIEQAGYRDAIEVRKPDLVETDYFGIPGDGRVEMTEIYRTGFDQDHNPVRLTITVYRADRNRFVINVGDVPMSGSLRRANWGESAQADSSISS